MNNYILKNIKTTLTSIESVLLTHDEDSIDTIILGGYVSNISNVNQPSLTGVTDYFNLKIYNTQTQEITNLYSEIPIKSNTCFPINKIHFNHYNQLICSSTYDNNLQITLSYFKTIDYDCGVIKVNFLPNEVISLLPTWYFTEQENEYNINEYVPVIKGIQNIEFQTILGWEQPDLLQINVTQLKTFDVTATYILLDSIVSFFTEQINLIDSFQWKLVDSDIWLNNLETMILSPGEYEFEFLEIDSYYKPDNIVINTIEKTNYNQKITYEKIQEYIIVNLTPPYIKLGKTFILNNRWRIVYPNLSSSPWYNSGEIVLFNINNDYIINIELNDYFEPEINDLTFNLEKDIPLSFNINMLSVS